GRVVVEDEVDVQVRGDGRLDRIEEPPELHGAVPAVTLANDLAAHHFERRKERRGPMADIVVRAALRLAGAHRQERLGPIEGLNLRLLVHAEHQGALRRIEVEADDVADFLDEQGMGRQLEAGGAMRLQAKSPPDARDGGLTQSEEHTSELQSRG